MSHGYHSFIHPSEAKKLARKKAHWAHRQEGNTTGVGHVERAEPDLLPQYAAERRFSFRDLKYSRWTANAQGKTAIQTF